MKISGYYKAKGNNVTLKLDYKELDKYDKVYISKVFTKTKIDDEILKLRNVKYGGTGFLYDKAEPLDNEIEHHYPDYELYSEWVNEMLQNGTSKNELKYYTDYSIGYTTRGCFRKCKFCVNQKYDKVFPHSPVSEFLNESKKKICLLDDNILGYKNSKEIFQSLIKTNKKFEFKQGLDIRLINEENIKYIVESKLDKEIIFAFDNYKDKDLIIKKIKLFKKYSNKKLKFYVLCAFDDENKYDTNFWIKDIENTFKRIKILMEYECLAYVMKFEKYKDSEYKGTYINISNWCNFVPLYKKLSYEEFSYYRSKNDKTASVRYMKKLKNDYPYIAEKYFNFKYEDYR